MVAIRWYRRSSLSYRDIEELLVERGVEVDHVTVYRWVQRFAPLLATEVVTDAAPVYPGVLDDTLTHLRPAQGPLIGVSRCAREDPLRTTDQRYEGTSKVAAIDLPGPFTDHEPHGGPAGSAVGRG